MRYIRQDHSQANKGLVEANIKLVDRNKELVNTLMEISQYILDKSVEYKPDYRKVDLNTKDCMEIINIIEKAINHDDVLKNI